MRLEVIDRNRGGMWPWLGQRVTAVLVIVTILVHITLTHYVAAGKLDFNNIAERLTDRAVVVNDMVLLFAVVYHALNGFRMVVLDYALSGKTGRVIFNVVLWAIGISVVIYGTWALWVWVA